MRSGMKTSMLGHAGAELAAIAVSGDVLATCTGRRIEISSGVISSRLKKRATWEEPAEVGTLALAPSGRFLMLRSASGDAIEVRRTDGGASLARLEAEPGRPFAVGTIAGTPDGELLVASIEPKRLEVRHLDTGEKLHDELVERPRGFFHRFLVPLTDGDTVVGIGYYGGEGKDTLAGISLRRLLTEDGYLAWILNRRPPIDEAYQLAAGPCGQAGAVFYRDPGDGEDPEDECRDDPNRLNVYGVRGLYVRRLSDLSVVGTTPMQPAAVSTGAALTGTEHHFVMAVADGALVVPRSGAPATLLPATRIAIDTGGGRCVLASEDGELRLLALS
jgi:hypothetical protein